MIKIAIRLQFDYDSASIQLRFGYDEKWTAHLWLSWASFSLATLCIVQSNL